MVSREGSCTVEHFERGVVRAIRRVLTRLSGMGEGVQDAQIPGKDFHVVCWNVICDALGARVRMDPVRDAKGLYTSTMLATTITRASAGHGINQRIGG